jgi:hypothetical protein
MVSNPSAWTLAGAELLILALPAVLLLVLTMVFTWRYRKVVSHNMNQRGTDPSDLPAGSGILAKPDGARETLALYQVEGQAPVTLLAGDKRDQARQAGMRVRWIFGIAGGIQMVLTTGAMYWFLSREAGFLSMVYPPLLTAYLTMLPGLLLLATFSLRRTRSRVALLAAYLSAGFGVIALGPDHVLANGPHVVASNLKIGLLHSVEPLLGVSVLLARWLRPFLLALAAFCFFALSGTFLFGIFNGRSVANMNLGDITPLAVVLALTNLCLGAALLFWLLRKRKREKFKAVGLFVTVILAASAVEHWLLPNLPVGQIATGTASNALQFYMLWLVFQGFKRLQEQNFVPGEVLHYDLCWLFLALYITNRIFVLLINRPPSRAISLALFLGLVPFLGYAVSLHMMLRREWIAQRDRPGRRLLLLRVFGDAAKRVRLFDMLGETWRRVGRIDFIAGTDVAQRHIDAHALEAFLLGRLTTIFLKSPAEVDQFVEGLRGRLEGDLRYPVNELYCYDDTWQYAVTRLAPDCDAAIMDLRGFTSSNRGCAFELGVLVRTLPLERILLLTDSTTGAALAETIQTAWRAAPVGNANVRLATPQLLLIPFTEKTKRDRDILESWLFSVAFGATTHPG